MYHFNYKLPGGQIVEKFFCVEAGKRLTGNYLTFMLPTARQCAFYCTKNSKYPDSHNLAVTEEGCSYYKQPFSEDIFKV